MFRESSAWGRYLHASSVGCQCFCSLLDRQILLHTAPPPHSHPAPHATHLSSLIRISAWAFPQLRHLSPSVALLAGHTHPLHTKAVGAAEPYVWQSKQGPQCTWGSRPRREGARAGKTSAPRANVRLATKALLRNAELWEPQNHIR